MNKPDDFGLDLATRIALHEMLLQKLLMEVISKRPDAHQALRDIGDSLSASFDVSTLTAGGSSLTDEGHDWVQKQSAYGKEISEKFILKMARKIQSKE